LGVLLAGSVARGEDDDASDIDLILYHAERLPGPAARAAARDALGAGTPFFDVAIDPGFHAESLPIDGRKVDIAHRTVAAWDAALDAVLDDRCLDYDLHLELDGLSDGVALVNPGLIAPRQARARAMPGPLARAIIADRLVLLPRWVVASHHVLRDDRLAWHAHAIDMAARLIHVLLTLNGRFLGRSAKRLDRLVARMRAIAPPARFAERLTAVIGSPPAAGAPILDALQEQVIALVAAHAPHVDLAPVRARRDMPGAGG
jgi:hypothetical protein